MPLRSLLMIASSDDCTMAARRSCASSVALRSRMSRATFDAPMTRPDASRIGEIVNDTSTRRPSLDANTVSKWETFSPFHTRFRVSISSFRLSEGNSMSVDLPSAWAAVYPSSRSAAPFHNVMVPSRSCAMIASSEDDTIAARYRFGRRRRLRGHQPLLSRIV